MTKPTTDFGITVREYRDELRDYSDAHLRTALISIPRWADALDLHDLGAEMVGSVHAEIDRREANSVDHAAIDRAVSKLVSMGR